MKKFSILLVALAIAWPLQAGTKTAAFEVSGWTCGSCAAATRIALKKLDGVEDVKTDNDKKEALVIYDDSKVTTDRMVQAIAKLGYKAALKNGAAMASSPRSQSNAAPIAARDTRASSERLSFFEVPLECGAVESLGCGSAAKPILNELDRNSRIAEARINRPGTILAVVWKSPNDRPDSAGRGALREAQARSGGPQGPGPRKGPQGIPGRTMVRSRGRRSAERARSPSHRREARQPRPESLRPGAQSHRRPDRGSGPRLRSAFDVEG